MQHVRMRTRVSVLLSTFVFALTACGGDDSPAPQVAPSEAEASVAASPSESTVEEPKGPSDDDLRQFVQAITETQPDEVKQALDLTAPGSAARAIATVFVARWTAAQQAGFDLPEASSITGEDGRFEACREDSCQVFADFKAQGDLIADFSIDGNRMKNRVILGSNKTFPLGDLATARLIGSYKFSSDGSLGIFLEVSAKANVTFGWDSDAYVGPNGAQVGINEVTVPGTLRAGGRAIVAYYLPTAELGGDLFVTAVEDGGAQRDVTTTIPTG